MIIWSEIANKVLDASQKSMDKLLSEFSNTHILVWGTAIALQLGHRKSIDFDLFSNGPQGSGKNLFERINRLGYKMDLTMSNLNWLNEEEETEAIIFINGVKIQLLDFSRNPFDIKINLFSNKKICEGINSLSLLELGALKVYAMGYRKKWKDAVDIYFILKSGYSLHEIINKAKDIFSDLYKPNRGLENIIENKWDKTEKVEYIILSYPSDEEISDFLINSAKDIFI